jgi:hypothetical protein
MTKERTRRWPIWVGVVVALLGVLAVGVTLSALSARRELSEAEAALRQARSDLVDGEAAEAERGFEEARTRFSNATGVASGPWFRILSWVPVVGRTPDAVMAIAESGVHVSEAGATLAGAVGELPGGLDSLAPSEGRIPVERFEMLAGPVAEATDETAAALATLQAAPRSLLLGPVGSARAEAEEELQALLSTLESGSRLLDGLPGFLGDDEPKRYFFGAQNPAELRGTGGVIGAYSILTVEDGRLSFTRFAPVQSLPIPDLADVPPPSEEYAGNYDAFRGDGRFWLAINLTPDFPTAARAILNAYEVAEGERLNGVILADPFALESLLRVSGPAYVPGLDRTVRAADVVAFATNEAYSLYPDQATRKRVLGAVAEAALARFLAQRDTGVEDLRTLARTAAEGHILAYSEEPTMQAGLEATGAGGAFGTDPGDVVSVVENSSGGTKVDFYEDREVTYEIDLWPDGSAEATASVMLRNGAPSSGQPRYVIGPRPGFAEAGEGGQLLSIYCAPGCQLERAQRDGQEILVWERSEMGYPFYQDYFRTPSGGRSDLELTWYVPDAWEGDASGGTYRLTFLNQTTIRPTDVRVVIHAPDGMGISGTDPAMSVDGGTAVWQGVPERRLELEVRFQPPLLERIWRALMS